LTKNRWFQLGASVVAMVMIANLQYAWTLFVKPLQQGHDWRLSDVQWAFTLFILFQTWVQPLDGWLIDRMGPRVFISIAGVLCGVGWAGLGVAQTLPALYVLYAMAGVGAALVYSGSMGSALKWFRERRGLAAGIIAAGFGGGSALFIPAIVYLLQYHGYQTAFLWTGVVQGVVILGVAQFLRHPPEERADRGAPSMSSLPRLTRDRGSQSSSEIRRVRDLTTLEMLRAPQFYVLYAAFLLMATGGLLVTAQAGPIAQSWGISVTALALATSLDPLANGGSRIFWGWASDRLGRETAMGVAFLLNAACLLLVLTVGRVSGAWFVATLALVFFTWGEVFSLFPSTLGDYFGARHATSNYAVLYTAKGVASTAVGIAAVIYERFGSWSPVLGGSAILSLVAAALAFGLRAGPSPKQAVSLGPVVAAE
jgi:MFS transporter, OFA family, oxalate/formate antiporter